MEGLNAQFVKDSSHKSVTLKDTYYQSIVILNNMLLAVAAAKHLRPNNPWETIQDLSIVFTKIMLINIRCQLFVSES